MRYMGGKARIAKHVFEVIERYREGRVVLEPFCGPLNVTAALTGPRVASDVFRPLYSLYTSLRAGWDPPETVTPEEHAWQREHPDPNDPRQAFVGFGCSFSGVYFGGYARSTGRNYAAESRRALLARFARCSEVTFACASYTDYHPGPGVLAYCDPPYAGTSGYKTGAFDSARFWAVMSQWVDAGAVVLVSEFSAPAGWTSVWSRESVTGCGTKVTKDRPVEHIFTRAP